MYRYQFHAMFLTILVPNVEWGIKRFFSFQCQFPVRGTSNCPQHRLLIRSSADIPEWPGVTWEPFVKISALNGHWQATTNKGLAKHERCFTILSWCPSNINSVIDLIVHGSTIEIRKTSLSCFCNTFLRSVWTLKRIKFVKRIIQIISISTWYNSQSCCLKFCLT